MMLSIILYALLHDITRLSLFKNLGGTSFLPIYEVYKEVQKTALLFLKKLPLPLFRIINNYLVDFLWFLSFTFVFTEFSSLSRAINFIILICMALLSEFSQLLFPQLGTFDILDLGLYICVAGWYTVHH